jgi:hypothetical protein
MKSPRNTSVLCIIDMNEAPMSEIHLSNIQHANTPTLPFRLLDQSGPSITRDYTVMLVRETEHYLSRGLSSNIRDISMAVPLSPISVIGRIVTRGILINRASGAD